jgi:hypothetical protein
LYIEHRFERHTPTLRRLNAQKGETPNQNRIHDILMFLQVGP